MTEHMLLPLSLSISLYFITNSQQFPKSYCYSNLDILDFFIHSGLCPSMSPLYVITFFNQFSCHQRPLILKFSLDPVSKPSSIPFIRGPIFKTYTLLLIHHPFYLLILLTFHYFDLNLN